MMGKCVDQGDYGFDMDCEIFGTVFIVVSEAEYNNICILISHLMQDEFEDDI